MSKSTHNSVSPFKLSQGVCFQFWCTFLISMWKFLSFSLQYLTPVSSTGSDQNHLGSVCSQRELFRSSSAAHRIWPMCLASAGVSDGSASDLPEELTRPHLLQHEAVNSHRGLILLSTVRDFLLSLEVQSSFSNVVLIHSNSRDPSSPYR